MKGWKKRFFFLDMRAISNAMPWRHHDFDVNDTVSEDGFSALDVQKLTERGDLVVQHTTHLLLVDQPIPKKTNLQQEVEVKDPKIVVARERKAQAVARKREIEQEKRHCPLQTVGPIDNIVENPSETDTKASDSNGNHSVHSSPCGSATKSVHNYIEIDNDREETNSLRLRSFINLFGRDLNAYKTEVVFSSQADHSAHHSPTSERTLSLPRMILQDLHTHKGESSYSRDVYVLELTILHRCRIDSPMWYRVKEEHDGCANRLQVLDKDKNELSYVNRDQALWLKELEAELAKKDFALVYAERILAERAEEKERLITQLGWMLAEGWSKEDIMDALFRVENFNPYSHKKLYPMYDKLFEKQYPYAEKISRGFHHSVAKLLKVYLDPAPFDKAPTKTASKGPTRPSVSFILKKTYLPI
uniref:Uncharacterized protein n=1 Tax=Tanacetum cinerariifolium TaxID=118510 RepID=A0A6L2KAW4_TANCI|nr:hypothetical protein [Tanacetum cinerariifolium]